MLHKTEVKKTNGIGHSAADEERRMHALEFAKHFQPPPAAAQKVLDDASLIEAWLRDGKKGEGQ